MGLFTKNVEEPQENRASFVGRTNEEARVAYEKPVKAAFGKIYEQLNSNFAQLDKYKMQINLLLSQAEKAKDKTKNIEELRVQYELMNDFFNGILPAIKSHYENLDDVQTKNLTGKIYAEESLVQPIKINRDYLQKVKQKLSSFEE